jgi:cytochrome c5
MIRKHISMAVCLFVAACGGGEDSKPAPEPTAYEDMSFQQREALMRDVVLPKMTETFVAFDAKFKGMDCKTCHGDGATDGTYAMPSPQIPVLPGSEAAFGEYVKDPEQARWTQFMIDQVWPQMASLLQVAKFDPATSPGGFSCSNCHTHAVEGAPN